MCGVACICLLFVVCGWIVWGFSSWCNGDVCVFSSFFILESGSEHLGSLVFFYIVVVFCCGGSGCLFLLAFSDGRGLGPLLASAVVVEGSLWMFLVGVMVLYMFVSRFL